jgi:hypothetical protein
LLLICKRELVLLAVLEIRQAREEQIMKGKFVIIGAALVAIAAPLAAAPAGSARLPERSQQSIIRDQLGEIGAWAVPSTSAATAKAFPEQSQQAIVREKLGEIGAWAVPKAG